MRSIALDDLLQEQHPGASFHDASVEGYYFDARSQSLELYVQIALYGPTGGKPHHLPGVLAFSEVLSFHVEAPGNGRSQRSDGLWLTSEGPVASLPPESGAAPALPDAPAHAFHHYLYFSDVNSFMFIAAMEAEFAWREVADERRGGAA